MVIHGGEELQGGRVTSHGDHRIAMSMAVAALRAAGAGAASRIPTAPPPPFPISGN